MRLCKTKRITSSMLVWDFLNAHFPQFVFVCAYAFLFVCAYAFVFVWATVETMPYFVAFAPSELSVQQSDISR